MKPGPSKRDHAFAAEHLRFKHLEGHPIARDWRLGSRFLAGSVKRLSDTSGKILMQQHRRLRLVSVDWMGASFSRSAGPHPCVEQPMRMPILLFGTAPVAVFVTDDGVDLDAQMRDRLSVDPARDIDRGLGQYGGGIFE